MKKTLMTLVLLVWTTILLSQTYANAVNLTIGVRDDQNSKFTWGETKQLDELILVKFENNEVFIYTEDIQFYQTLKPEHTTKNNGGSWWFAVDASGKRCKLYLFYKGGNILMMEYDDVCIIYGLIYN